MTFKGPERANVNLIGVSLLLGTFIDLCMEGDEVVNQTVASVPPEVPFLGLKRPII